MHSFTSALLKPLVVYGAAGHAKVVFDIVKKQGVYRIISVLDRYKPVGTACGDLLVSGSMEELPEMFRQHPDLEVIVAIGDNWARARISFEIMKICPEICFGVAIHPSAQLGSDVTVGLGTVIMAGVIVNPSAQVGEGCILNTRASLDHDAVMGHYSSLGPAAAVGGGVRIGAYSSLGIGASVIQEIRIGEQVVIGAGAVVVRHIPDATVAYGVPARVVHRREVGERYMGQVTGMVRPQQGNFSSQWSSRHFYHFTKRALDVLIAASALLVLAPVMAVVAVLVRWKLGSPVIFRHPRPGLREKTFDCIKFRSMTNERDAQGQLLKEERRLTEFGKLLRRTSLDELPQLWSVLVGDMSLVGPRPLEVRYLPRYSTEQNRRHSVLPGITGWAQVNGRNEIEWARKLALDVWYVDHRSLALDFKILLLTFWTVVTAAGVAKEGHASMEEFFGTAKGNSE